MALCLSKDFETEVQPGAAGNGCIETALALTPGKKTGKVQHVFEVSRVQLAERLPKFFVLVDGLGVGWGEHEFSPLWVGASHAADEHQYYTVKHGIVKAKSSINYHENGICVILLGKERHGYNMLAQMPIYNKLKILIAQKENAESRKLTYKTVAEEADVPVSVLIEYNGQRVRRYDVNTLEKLCRYFGIQPGDLLGFTDTTAPPKKTKTARK